MAQILQTPHGLKYQVSDTTFGKLMEQSDSSLIFSLKKIGSVIENAESFPFFVSNLTFILLSFISDLPWWVTIIYSSLALVVSALISHIAILFFMPVLSSVLYIYHNVIMRFWFIYFLLIAIPPAIWAPNWYIGLVYLGALIIVNTIMKFTTENYNSRTKFNERVVEKVLSSHPNNVNNTEFCEENKIFTPTSKETIRERSLKNAMSLYTIKMDKLIQNSKFSRNVIHPDVVAFIGAASLFVFINESEAPLSKYISSWTTERIENWYKNDKDEIDNAKSYYQMMLQLFKTVIREQYVRGECLDEMEKDFDHPLMLLSIAFTDCMVNPNLKFDYYNAPSAQNSIEDILDNVENFLMPLVDLTEEFYEVIANILDETKRP